MFKYDVLVPTCSPIDTIADFLSELRNSLPEDVNLIISHFPVSAAVNRNYCLMNSKSEYVIMLDDDMCGFTYGWSDSLVKALVETDAAMVSARLINPDGSFGCMMDIEPNTSKILQTVPKRYLPSACVAFRNDGCRFDEQFIGSSWEDTDFCDTLQKRYPEKIFLIHNGVRLIHHNDQKNGNPEVFAINREYYAGKHGRIA